MKRTLALIVAATTLAGVATACGDDRPSSEALAEEVTEICQAAGERREQAAAGFDFEGFDPETSDLTVVIPLIEDNVAIGREVTNELDMVSGPKADEAKVDRWIEVNAQIADNADGLIDAAGRGDREQLMALSANEDELHGQFPDDAMFEGC